MVVCVLVEVPSTGRLPASLRFEFIAGTCLR